MCRRVCQRDREVERGQAVTNTSKIIVPDGKMQMHQTSQAYSGSRLLVLMGDSDKQLRK